jgi:hypothetical protein
MTAVYKIFTVRKVYSEERKISTVPKEIHQISEKRLYKKNFYDMII